jgi:hypothetical protein
MDIEVSSWSLKTLLWDKMDIEVSVLGPQDHPLRQGGHQGQCLVHRTIPGTRWATWSVVGPQDRPLGQGGHLGQCLGPRDHSMRQGGHQGQFLVLKGKLDIEVNAWSSGQSPGTRWTSRSILDPQDHLLGQGGHRGQYLILKTIPWDKVDIEVNT